MPNTVDVNQIKQYNASLREYKEKANRLSTEIEVREAELKRLCAELTKDLGYEVTSDNIQEVYNNYVNKIQADLQHGISILNRISDEEKEIEKAAKAREEAERVQAQTQSKASDSGQASGQALGAVDKKQEQPSMGTSGGLLGAALNNQGVAPLTPPVAPEAPGMNNFPPMPGASAYGSVPLPNLFGHNDSGVGISMGNIFGENDDDEEDALKYL